MAKNQYRVSSVERALDILEWLDETGQAYTTSEISRHLQLAKSSAHGVLTTLESRGYVTRDVKGRFSLGQEAFRFGFGFLQDLRERDIARPFLEELSELLDETCHMAVHVGNAAVYVEKIERPQTVRLASNIGARAALHASAVGKVILAYMSDTERERFLAEQKLPRFTAMTITDPESLCQHLATIRDRGYAIDDQEEHEGVRCVGAPVRNYLGKVVAAVSVASLTQRLTDERLPAIAQRLMQATEQISHQLGYELRTAK